MLALTLSELSLLSSKQVVYETIRSSGAEAARYLQPYSESQLAGLYEESFDLDGHLLFVAFRLCR